MLQIRKISFFHTTLAGRVLIVIVYVQIGLGFAALKIGRRLPCGAIARKICFRGHEPKETKKKAKGKETRGFAFFEVIIARTDDLSVKGNFEKRHGTISKSKLLISRINVANSRKLQYYPAERRSRPDSNGKTKEKKIIILSTERTCEARSWTFAFWSKKWVQHGTIRNTNRSQKISSRMR